MLQSGIQIYALMIERRDRDMKKAGMILEGGGQRGIFTSGVLDYLMEKKVELPYVIGVSAGACNAVDYVSNQILRTRSVCWMHSSTMSCMVLRR